MCANKLLRNLLVIANPVAGNGKTAQFLHHLKERLGNAEIAYTLKKTTKDRNGEVLAKECFSNQFSEILVLGGDGTFHEVINGVQDFSKPIGVVQTGTGNDFSKALGKVLSPVEQLEKVIHGNIKTIDLGLCNNRLFHNGVGIGFDGWVGHRTTELRKNRSSSVWSYYQAVVEGIFRFRSPEMRLRSSEHGFSGKHFMITVGNGVAFGGGFRVTPKAELDDGLLDICAVAKVSIPGRLWRLPFLTLGKHASLPSINYLKVDALHIDGSRPLHAHIDGETFSANSFEIGIRPGLLRLRR